jgi:hypothetical protein
MLQMMHFSYLLWLLLAFSLSSRAQQPPYSLLLQEGIWIEQFDSSQTDKNRFTANNKVFKEGYRFIYRYQYQDEAGAKFLQRIKPSGYTMREDNWLLVPLAQKDSLTNDLIRITVLEGLEGLPPSHGLYHQTPILYEYFSPAGPLYFTAQTGLVENEKNLWMHPPRERLFRILQLNPFPFIQAPYTTGHHWSWELEIGEQWGDARWASWQGSITNRYRYQISGQELLATPMGELRCWVVVARARSELGITGLTAYFHPDWGFVRLEYTNIDGSRIVMEMVGRE